MVGNATGAAPDVRAKRVVVPIANPATAMGLIRLAWQLADPDEGHVDVLHVTLAGAEHDQKTLDVLSSVVEEAVTEGINAGLITRTAPSIARGILDAALEQGATLLVLGFQMPARGRVTLGPIVEAVARTAPCDLVVFRAPGVKAVRLENIQQVIVPVHGSENSRVAARLGLVLADAYQAEPMAIYVQTEPDLPSWFGLARIEASLVGLEGARRYQRQVVRANDVVSAVVSRSDPDDLIVLGFSERMSLDRWIFGDIPQRILAQAAGPVILVREASRPGLSPIEQLRRRWLTRLMPVLTPSERTDVIHGAVELSQPGINFLFLMVVSSLLASFGLLQNSAAVIIGAMLVAPLMSPLMSFSVGLVQGNLRLMRGAAFTVALGVLIGLSVAVVGGTIMPIHVITGEMSARGEPSLLDMGVAIASGAAGAYAMARRDVPSALAGVAIAAALVPPLCTVGLALAFGQMELASGAGLLFLTNIVSISLAGAGVFAWLGLRPAPQSRTWRQVIISLIVLMILALPLASAFVRAARTAQQVEAVRRTLEQEFSANEIVQVTIEGDRVIVTARGTQIITRDEVRLAEQAIERTLGRNISLEVTYWRTLTP